MSYDDWKTTEPEPYAGSRIPDRVRFPYACDGLITAIRTACQPTESLVDEVYREAEAVWFAKHVAHEARRLGLLKETLDVSVLLRLDVEAGEVMTP